MARDFGLWPGANCNKKRRIGFGFFLCNLMQKIFCSGWLPMDSCRPTARLSPKATKRLSKKAGVFVNKYDLERFIYAQECYYQTALREVQDGCKRSHWMWYIFPQITGLGNSWKAQKYSISDVGEAVSYMQHPVLGPRLVEISQAVLELAPEICPACFGSPDDLKLRSCMTLFAEACPEISVFQAVLDKFYRGEKDPLTLEILKAQ